MEEVACHVLPGEGRRRSLYHSGWQSMLLMPTSTPVEATCWEEKDVATAHWPGSSSAAIIALFG